MRFVTIPAKDCPEKRSLPKTTVDLMGADKKKEYKETIRKLKKMMKVSLQEFTELRADEFDFLLQHCGIIKSTTGKWNTLAAEQFLNNELGSDKIRQCHPWQGLKCGSRWWILLGEG